MDEGNSRIKPFPTTQWSLIVRAAAADPADREKALAEICELYWPPVYAFIRSRGNSPHDAEDLTQGLFAELLERNDFASNHLVEAHRHKHRLKRGGYDVILSIDAEAAEMRCLIPEPRDEMSPDRVFERQWAITVMEGVVTALQERYEQKGQRDLFHALKPFLMAISAAPQAEKLGMSAQTLRVSLHRLRQRYAELLRQAVKNTLGPHENVEDEIAHLMSAFH
jgi:RNA polymerase sigma-70 factor (ECF subfamily)